MIELQVQQGSSEWLQARAKCFNASEAPAMMGVSSYKTRTELLRQKATGIVPEVDAATQLRFDDGHAAEAAARPLVEAMIGKKLIPSVATDDSGKFLASMDGVDVSDDFVSLACTVGFEHKLWNANVAAQVENGEVPESHKWQLDQQFLVFGFEKIIFVCSDGTLENFVSCWYYPQPDRIAKLRAGWEQFEKDLANYQHVESKPKVVPSPTNDFPAIVYRLNGLSLTSNIDAYKEAATKLVEDSNKKLVTDQDFADRDYLNKRFAEAEKTIDIVSAQAIGEIKDVDKFCRDLSEIKGLIRQARINGENAVKTEKENRKSAIVNEASQQLGAHVIALQERVGVQFKPEVVNLADAIKGLKSLDSMHDKISVALANAKIEANADADRIDANRKAMGEHSALFPDFSKVCTKEQDDFAALVAMRVAQQKERDEKRLEAEREKIRAEEQAKAEAERLNAEAGLRAIAATKPNDSHKAVNESLTDSDIKQSIQIVSACLDEMVDQVSGTGKTIKLGEINAMLAPVSISADGLASLGILPVAHEKNAKLYSADKFATICRLISEHVMAQAFKKAA